MKNHFEEQEPLRTKEKLIIKNQEIDKFDLLIEHKSTIYLLSLLKEAILHETSRQVHPFLEFCLKREPGSYEQGNKLLETAFTEGKGLTFSWLLDNLPNKSIHLFLDNIINANCSDEKSSIQRNIDNLDTQTFIKLSRMAYDYYLQNVKDHYELTLKFVRLFKQIINRGKVVKEVLKDARKFIYHHLINFSNERRILLEPYADFIIENNLFQLVNEMLTKAPYYDFIEVLATKAIEINNFDMFIYLKKNVDTSTFSHRSWIDVCIYERFYKGFAYLFELDLDLSDKDIEDIRQHVVLINANSSNKKDALAMLKLIYDIVDKITSDHIKEYIKLSFYNPFFYKLYNIEYYQDWITLEGAHLSIENIELLTNLQRYIPRLICDKKCQTESIFLSKLVFLNTHFNISTLKMCALLCVEKKNFEIFKFIIDRFNIYDDCIYEALLLLGQKFRSYYTIDFNWWNKYLVFADRTIYEFDQISQFDSFAREARYQCRTELDTIHIPEVLKDLIMDYF